MKKEIRITFFRSFSYSKSWKKGLAARAVHASSHEYSWSGSEDAEEKMKKEITEEPLHAGMTYLA